MTEVIEIQVFVSCPTDVNEEKKKVEEECEHINRIIQQSSSVPIRLSVLEFGQIVGICGKNPQRQIDKLFSSYDIYLGILGSRFGTPPGDSNPETGKKFESGTEQEFYYALKRLEENPDSLECYIYFKEFPAGFHSPETLEQMGKVSNFRQSLIKTKEHWVNPFKAIDDFRRMVNQSLMSYVLKVAETKLKETKENLVSKSLNGDEGKDSNGELISSFSRGLKLLPYYISRSFRSAQQIDEESLDSSFAAPTFKLFDLIEKHSCLVILGNAGSGKSVELQQLVLQINNAVDGKYVAVYRKFNTYADETIENFLPQGWEVIPRELLVIVVDGLDEIAPSLFAGAIRKILKFRDDNQAVRIVISARTNFYELPNSISEGTLPGFKCFYLNDLTNSDVVTYVNNSFEENGTIFLTEAIEQNFNGVVVQPFFLKLLLDYFIEKRDLSSDKGRIIENFILSRFEHDKSHFQLPLGEVPDKSTSLTALRKVAFAMELTGKTSITDEELALIIPSNLDRNNLRRFTAFTKCQQVSNAWEFEHNNIQEYLAASVLVDLPTEQLKRCLSFPPDFRKIKPSWINTLSFYVGIVNDSKRAEIISWVLEVEEEVVVKFERDKVPENLRFDLLKRIFLKYKQKDIWLRSNKFSYIELAKFVQSSDALEFLIREISAENSSNIAKIIALQILANFDYSLFGRSEFDVVKAKFFEALVAMADKPGNVYSILDAMAEMGATDESSVRRVFTMFNQRDNEYIRAGLYRVIAESKYANEFVDAFIRGIEIDASGKLDDRGKISLGDESYYFSKGLKKIDSFKAISKVFEAFNSLQGRLDIVVYDYREIVKVLISKLAHLYKGNEEVLQVVFSHFIQLVKIFEPDLARSCLPFFTETNTVSLAFERVLLDDKMDSYARSTALALLSTTESIKLACEYFVNLGISEDAVLRYYFDLKWFEQKGIVTSSLVELAKVQIQEFCAINIDELKQQETNDRLGQRLQENFDLLFDREGLIRSVSLLFKSFDRDRLLFSEAYEHHRRTAEPHERFLPLRALSVVGDFDDGTGATLKQIVDWFNSDENFSSYQIKAIYEDLRNSNKRIVLNERQRRIIEDWVRSNLRNLDGQEMVKVDEIAGNINVSWVASSIWFFVDNLNITVDPRDFLAFTEFEDFKGLNSQKAKSVMEKVVELSGKKAVRTRVIENLSRASLNVYIWRANALFALENGIFEAYPDIIDGFLSDKFNEEVRLKVAERYFKQTKNFAPFKQLLKGDMVDEFRIRIAGLLVEESEFRGVNLTFLHKILADFSLSDDLRLSAAALLIKLNDIDGFGFYLAWILQRRSLGERLHEVIGAFQRFDNPAAVSGLIELLDWSLMYGGEDNGRDHITGLALDALVNISQTSESNLVSVCELIERFIEEKSGAYPGVNAFVFTIERAKERFYSSRQFYTVPEAVKEASKYF